MSRWTPADVELLAKLVSSRPSLTWREIGYELNRTPNAVLQKWHDLGYIAQSRANGRMSLSVDGKRNLRKKVLYLEKVYGTCNQLARYIDLSHTTIGKILEDHDCNVSKVTYRKIVDEYERMRQFEGHSRCKLDAAGQLRKRAS